MSRIIIAIDGPSGSGKSSVARALAQAYGLQYLDTGAMYRAFAWWNLQGHEDVSNCPLAISTDPNVQHVLVGSTDITEAIRGPEVTSAVSRIASLPEVRAEAVRRQRDIINRATEGIAVEGRDITSVVAPNADVRIFLTADLAARELRRAAEFGDAELAERMRATVAARDAIDATREHSPLVAVDGVTRIDATHRSLPEVISLASELVERALQEALNA